MTRSNAPNVQSVTRSGTRSGTGSGTGSGDGRRRSGRATPVEGVLLEERRGRELSSGPMRPRRARAVASPGRPVETAAPKRLPAPTPAAATREPTHEEIAAEAHRLWLAHGGNEIVNWLEAEARLRRRFTEHG